MSRRRFYDVVSEAVSDIVEHGFDSQERLQKWLIAIRRAAGQALIPEHELEELLRKSLSRVFRGAASLVVLQHKHVGIPAFKLEQIRYGLHAELRRRIQVGVDLIKLNRSAAVEQALQRFAGWASSVPAGGSDAVSRKETGEKVRRSIAALPFVERRVVIDQGHKLVAAVNDIVARDGGAIAMRWHHIHPGPHYDSRPEHLARDGKVFLIRDSWAVRDGLVKLAGGKYLDQIDQPGEKIFCSCSGIYLYVPSRLPPQMWTAKGRSMILKVAHVERMAVKFGGMGESK